VYRCSSSHSPYLLYGLEVLRKGLIDCKRPGKSTIPKCSTVNHVYRAVRDYRTYGRLVGIENSTWAFCFFDMGRDSNGGCTSSAFDISGQVPAD